MTGLRALSAKATSLSGLSFINGKCEPSVSATSLESISDQSVQREICMSLGSISDPNASKGRHTSLGSIPDLNPSNGSTTRLSLTSNHCANPSSIEKFERCANLKVTQI